MKKTISLDNIFILKYCLGITIYSLLILNLFSFIGISKAFAVSNPITPTPTMNTGNCKAVVTYSWDISDIPNANRAFWELKKDSDFTNLEGRESSRIDRGSSNSLQGSVTIDLRDHGQVLNGTKYYFRVVAKEGTEDVARRSDSVKFDLDYSPNNTYSAKTITEDPYQVEVDWSNLKSEIKNCSDRVYYEVKKNSAFTNLTGAEPGRVTSDSATGRKTMIDLSQEEPGDYYVRIVGKSGSKSVDDDIGKRGSGVKVTIGEQETPPSPAPTPTQAFQPVHITTQPLIMTGLRGEVLSAKLTVRIIDSANRSYISKAQVNVKHSDSSTTLYDRSKTTDISGLAVFNDLTVGGNYTISATKSGCQDLQKNIAVSSENPSDSLHMDCGNTAGDITISDDIDKAIAPDSGSPKIPIKPIDMQVDKSRTQNLELLSFKIGEGTGAQNKVQDARYNAPITYKSSGLIPSHYRIKKCPITNADWKPLNAGTIPTIDLLRAGKDKYCFQLKSSTNVESNIIEKSYFVKLVERTIGTDVNPIEYARQKGFQFGARDQISQSACGIAPDGSISWNNYQDVSCKFSLFSGRKLKYPWKVKEIKIIRQTAALGREDATNDFDFIRKPSGDNLYFTFLFEEEKLQDSPTDEFWEGARKVFLDPFKTPTQNPTVYGVRIYKFEYTLQGPTGISWTDAFD